MYSCELDTLTLLLVPCASSERQSLVYLSLVHQSSAYLSWVARDRSLFEHDLVYGSVGGFLTEIFVEKWTVDDVDGQGSYCHTERASVRVSYIRDFESESDVHRALWEALQEV